MRNSNGVVDSGELLSMEQAGVRRLGVDYVTSTLADPEGNRHLQIGSFLAADGTTQGMHDVWFRLDRARTRWLYAVPVDEAINVYQISRAWAPSLISIRPWPGIHPGNYV